MAHDHESLRTASTYLNNLLLARGLLRNSVAIDFVKPTRETRANIINLVHDLVIQHDKDSHRREHVASTLASLRVADSRKSQDLERLARESEGVKRELVQAQVAERTAKQEVKRVEKAAQGLRESSARLKTTLAQVRTQCANDLRRRDTELAKLRNHLQSGQRGARGGSSSGVVAPSLTVTGGRARNKESGGKDVGDPDYELRQETAEFLTQLSQSLSDENDGLISVVRGALETLRKLLGPAPKHEVTDSGLGSLGSGEEVDKNDDMLKALPMSYETLASDMDAVLEQLKGILTNPNFVSVDEVEVRDEEIERLRDGWMYMEKRWKDVLLMMEGWRRKMDTGHTINLDDLSKGMGLMSPQQSRQDYHLPSSEDQAADECMLSISNLDGEDPSEIHVSTMSTDEPPAQPASQPPKHDDIPSPKRKRDMWEPPEFFDLRPSGRKAAMRSPGASSPAPLPQLSELEAELDASNEEEEEEEEGPAVASMTVAQKLDLARAEAEAKAAAVAAPSPAKRSSKRKSNDHDDAMGGASSHGMDGAGDNTEGDDTLGKMMPTSAVKKTKIKGRPRRRKSTLSPEELEALMGNGLGEMGDEAF